MPTVQSLILCIALFLTASCSVLEPKDEAPSRIAHQPTILDRQQRTTSEPANPEHLPETFFWDHLCPFGIPQDQSGIPEDLKLLIQRDGYTLKHHHVRKTAIFVCEHPTREDVHGSLSGRANWRSDPAICTETSACRHGATDSDYTKSGYDRGHLAPNMNQRRDLSLKKQTFYLSNAAPQVGAGFNRTVWASLERDLTVLSCDAEKMWTITGPLYVAHQPLAKDSLGFEKIGAGQVWVPTHFFKLVIWLNNKKLHGFAVALENRQHSGADSYRNYRVSLDWLEQASQLDLLPELREDEEAGFANKFASFPDVSWSDCQRLCGDVGRCN